MLKAVAVLWLTGASSCVFAQDTRFDGDAFVRQLNQAVTAAEGPGITVSGTPSLLPRIDAKWADIIASKPQDFGIVAYDAKKNPIDLFGGDTPYEVTGGAILVPGYQLPEGGSFGTVGAAGYTKAAIALAAYEPQAPSQDIQNAVQAIADATDYVAEMLCSHKSRPTKLILHLTAGFDLVFSGETGSQVEWEMETVCGRMASQ